MKKRNVDILVLSDIHLGTYGCQAKALEHYLKGIKPEMLILNGDIIDIWQFSKNYFPKAHLSILQRILKIAISGVPVYYLTGNHDDALRRFSGSSLGNFHLEDKLLLEVDGKKAWFFHGDVFDASIQCSRWLARLGGVGYTMLILLNTLINAILMRLGRPRMSFSKKVKDNMKRAIAYVSDFEQTAAEIAIENGYDYVVCGHIHNPQDRIVTTSKGSVRYLNSGDWIENRTALEYTGGEWSIYKFEEKERMPIAETPVAGPASEQLLQRVMNSKLQAVSYENIVRSAGNG
ncbi:MAG: UDP-2,3-diacylglucosamine diphosphatase [Bacteroidota bacterium]